MSDMTVEKAQALLDGATPGPWTVKTGNVPIADTGDYDGYCHLIAGGRISFEHWGDDEQSEKDANFAAAAPDLARAYIAQAAELNRLRAMLTPPDDVQCYTVDALKYNDGLDLPGDMPMVPADLVTRLRARIEAADKLAEAVALAWLAIDQGRMVPRPGAGIGGMTIEANIRSSVYNGVPAWPLEELRAALSTYEEAQK